MAHSNVSKLSPRHLKEKIMAVPEPPGVPLIIRVLFVGYSPAERPPSGTHPSVLPGLGCQHRASSTPVHPRVPLEKLRRSRSVPAFVHRSAIRK